MLRRMIIAFGLLLALVSPEQALADIEDNTLSPPAEGTPGSLTDHVYQWRLGGCGFALGSRPANPDDLPMGGRCRRRPAPSAAAAPAAPGPGAQPGEPSPAAPPPPPPDPAEIAYGLAFDLDWDAPVPQTAPGWRQGHTITGITTWLWVDDLDPLTASVTVRGLTVRVTAKPAATTWDLTEATVECDGLGRRYDENETPSCAHTFRNRSTDRDDDGRYPGLVTVAWDIRWRSSDGRTGTLGQAHTAARFRIAVTGAEAVTD